MVKCDIYTLLTILCYLLYFKGSISLISFSLLQLRSDVTYLSTFSAFHVTVSLFLRELEYIYFSLGNTLKSIQGNAFQVICPKLQLAKHLT